MNLEETSVCAPAPPLAHGVAAGQDEALGTVGRWLTETISLSNQFKHHQ